MAQETTSAQARLGSILSDSESSVGVAESLTGGELAARFASAPGAGDWFRAVAVTGVGGPDAQDGEPPGTVWLALAHDGATITRLQRFSGSPEAIVDATCACAVEWVIQQCERRAADG